MPLTDLKAIRRSIAGRARALGPGLHSASPVAIIAAMSAAALLPVVGPALGLPLGAALAGAIGATGQSVIADLVSGLLKRMRQQGRSTADLGGELERELALRLDGQDEDARALRREVSELLRSTGALETTLAAVSEDVRQVLVERLAELDTRWDEFAWLLNDVRATLDEIGTRQVEQLVMQREALDLQREQLAKTTGLLQLLRPLPTVERGVSMPDGQDGDTPICPYKGLKQFQSEDAELFFGRESDVERMLARLMESRFLGVIGPSGSGKSSAVRAGLVPAVWNGEVPGSPRWVVLVLTPGPRPAAHLVAELSRRLEPLEALLPDDAESDPAALEFAVTRALLDLPAGTRVLVVVDQLEEVFTLCREERQRECFIAALLALRNGAAGKVHLVCALRADFYGHTARYADFGAAFQEQQFLLGPLGAESLRRAIEAPAHVAGLTLEPGLTERILDDVGREPGGLPLLSHALLETWNNRDGRTLTIDGYERAGGVHGAIAKSAETVFQERLGDRERIVARGIFLRLVEPAEGRDATRRRASTDELVTRPEEAELVDRVVAALVASRLLISGGQGVELAHEALIREWPTLRRWLEDEREGLVIHRRLTEDVQEWLRLDRDRGALYRGARLQAARDWATGNQDQLNPLEREFLAASAADEQSELELANRRARRLRALVGALIVLLGVAAVAVVLFVRQTDRAERESRLARSAALAAQALSGQRLDQALLMSVEAYEQAQTLTARKSVMASLQESAGVTAFLPGHTGVSSTVYADDGRLLASGDQRGDVLVWSPRRPGSPIRLQGHRDPVTALRFTGAGRRLLSADTRGVVIEWDVTAKRRVRTVVDLKAAAGEPMTIAFDPRGRFLISSEWVGDGVDVWSTATGDRLQSIPLDSIITTLAVSPDGDRFAVGDAHGLIALFDRRGKQRVAKIAGDAVVGVEALAFSPDGERLATGETDGQVRVWSVPRLRPLTQPLHGHGERINSVAFSPNGRKLASGGDDRSVIVWDLESGYPQGSHKRLRGYGQGVTSVSFDPEGKLLASGDESGQLALRDVTFAGPGRLVAVHCCVPGVAFSADSRKLASEGKDADSEVRVAVHDLARRRTLITVGSLYTTAFALSPNAALLAVGNLRGRVELYDVETKEQLPTPPFPKPKVVDEFNGLERAAEVQGLAFAPRERTLAAAWEGGTAVLYDQQRRRVAAELRGPGGEVTGLAFSPDGRLMAMSAHGGRIALWDAHRHRPLGAWLRAPEAVRGIAFSPDGRRLAAASGHTVVLWDVATRRRLHSLGTHRGAVEGLAYSPDGRTLAAAADDGRLTLWDVQSGERLAEPIGIGMSDVPTEVTFSPDGRRLAWMADQDGIYVWEPVLGSPDIVRVRAHACGLVRENLPRSVWAELLPGVAYRATCPSGR